MTSVDEQGRTEPPLAADEIASLRGFLGYQRQTLEWKTRGLGRDGLAATTASSSMTLGGLLKHLSFVEDYWFRYRLTGEAPSEPWRSVDWEADGDWDWNSAADDSPEELRAMWAAAVERSDAIVDDVMATDGLDAVAKAAFQDGRAPSLRWILLHMIEEYARHNGHADLLRESVDGETGE